MVSAKNRVDAVQTEKLMPATAKPTTPMKVVADIGGGHSGGDGAPRKPVNRYAGNTRSKAKATSKSSGARTLTRDTTPLTRAKATVAAEPGEGRTTAKGTAKLTPLATVTRWQESRYVKGAPVTDIATT
ncbi:hypothetical protein ON010_g18600 [Phytophthora cinnamomi]|nr:hypothetical protein ON010_g18600 [Phytophthora cinnamomi]